MNKTYGHKTKQQQKRKHLYIIKKNNKRDAQTHKESGNY